MKKRISAFLRCARAVFFAFRFVFLVCGGLALLVSGVIRSWITCQPPEDIFLGTVMAASCVGVFRIGCLFLVLAVTIAAIRSWIRLRQKRGHEDPGSFFIEHLP
jgi:hypothetical protein